MRLIKKDLKTNYLKLVLTTETDYYYLHKLIKKDDIVAGVVFRSVKLGVKQKNVRKKYNLKIIVKSVEFKKNPYIFRINGKVIDSNHSEIGNGVYQSISYELESVVKLYKKAKISKIDSQILTKAGKKGKKGAFLICLIDYGYYSFVNYCSENFENFFENFENLNEIEVKKTEKNREKFLNEFKKVLIKKMKDSNKVIIAANSFIDDKIKTWNLKPKPLILRTSETGLVGFKNLIDTKEVKTLLVSQEIDNENKLIERFFIFLSKKSEKIDYGLNNLKKLERGRIKEIIVSDELLSDNSVLDFLDELENFNTIITIVTSTTNQGLKFKNFGGIASFLNY